MKRTRRSRPPGRAGFILVMALGALAVMTILLVALFQGASHQIRGAESDATYAREKLLADSAVAQVIGQIQQASTQPGQAWISQPGLLRTYAGASRLPFESYKLYSAASLTDSSGNLNFLSSDVPADWNSTANANLYVDVNAPQQTSSALVYPILDPGALTNVEGVSSDSDVVAMPVMWLYVLQDGSVGPAGRGTKANPITGRIAFWTDDETSKININTSGCGSTWNTPRANSTDDVAWSTTQPAAGEFSRYPGHPATTSLVPIFGLSAGALSPQQLLSLTPRYAWGGSQAGAQSTTFGEPIPLKTDRLYPSLDELLFGTGFSANGQRTANPITPTQLEQARFVLTAHSVAPETTLLGEPRIAIWPVADTLTDSTRTTPADRAIASAATVGPGPSNPNENTRYYYFQRHNALSGTADLDITTTWGASNMQLFNELVARGGESLPGWGPSFTQKYIGAAWPQLVLEILDFIRGINAIDPSPAPVLPYASVDPATNAGQGFITPLTSTDPVTKANLRGLGRCPTLSSLTLVFYVCGFGFSPASKLAAIDYETNPDDIAGTNWKANFLPTSSKWGNVTSELIRAFVVPTTFHPGCAFPEVSDDCDIQIQGLNGIGLASPTSNEFGFQATATSPILGAPFTTLGPDRMWGGNEGPVAWRLAGDALADGATPNPTYNFAGTTAYALPLKPTFYNAATKSLFWQDPPATTTPFTFPGVTLTVLIRDSHHQPLQTLTVTFPAATLPAPSIKDEADHYDFATPGTSVSNWATTPAMQVMPSYYMNLENRLKATQGNRALMIQPGDVTRTMEAATDLRVISSFASPPSSFYQPTGGLTAYQSQTSQYEQLHNIRFADGTSAVGSYGLGATPAQAPTGLVQNAAYASKTAAMTGTNWNSGAADTIPNAWFTSPACSAPTRTGVSATYVTMSTSATPGLKGDWDTGPGFEPDGAMINLPDAGTSLDPTTAYFSLAGRAAGPNSSFLPTRFSPNALVPSPVIFGSLPAGINPQSPAQAVPWRTLLFCPNPAANFCATPPAANAVNATMHPGFAWPPDHLLLDNFWMPTIEPYALSTCMATAGKINLNDQIAPFTYLHRNTALHALLNDLRIPAIPATVGTTYKATGAPLASIWLPVDENATISQIESHDVYLSESEICTVPLVPMGVAASNLSNFWNGALQPGRLTGDNLRELPYAQLYGRLTTRSNSYTVHLHVQVLQKLPNDADQGVWKEGTDLVLGDWRGSYEIERDLDPAAQAPVAATSAAAGQPLGPYRFRIVSSRRFAP